MNSSPPETVYFPTVNSSTVRELELINWYLRFPLHSMHDREGQEHSTWVWRFLANKWGQSTNVSNNRKKWEGLHFPGTKCHVRSQVAMAATDQEQPPTTTFIIWITRLERARRWALCEVTSVPTFIPSGTSSVRFLRPRRRYGAPLINPFPWLNARCYRIPKSYKIPRIEGLVGDRAFRRWSLGDGN